MYDQWVQVQIQRDTLFGGRLTRDGYMDGAAFLVALDVLCLTGVLSSETCREMAQMAYDDSGEVRAVIKAEPARNELRAALRAELR